MDISYPTIDVNNSDVVYMIAKQNVNDPDGRVLVVNTKSKSLGKSGHLYGDKVYFCCTYVQCAFPKSPTKAPG